MQAALKTQINKTDRNDARGAAGSDTEIRMPIAAAVRPISEIRLFCFEGRGWAKA